VIVVSDTTPLHYLVLIGAVEILPALFEGVHAPSSVIRELGHPGASEAVRAWAEQLPAWLKVASPSLRLPSTAHLDVGEADAISLAKEIAALAVLLDEKTGRRVAIAEGFVVIRTLALLELAAERGLVDLRTMLTRLAGTTFRIDQSLIDAALARDSARKKA
jgi:predicted nucleic acid-binding protein